MANFFPLLLCLIPPSLSFNVDIAKPILLQGTSTKTLFGYSLALDNSSLFVGAPAYLGDGTVFRCDFDGKRVDSNQAFCAEVSPARTQAKEGSRDFLGASLALWRSKLFACAPRTGANRYSHPGSTTGTCYQYDKKQQKLSRFFEMSNPNSNSGWKLFTMMGHSMVPTEDGNIVIGAPLARATDFAFADERQTGHIFQVNVKSGEMSYPRTREVLWASRTRSTNDEPHTYDLAGSAIVRGRFFYDKADNHYVVGAPKANRLRGRVFLCPDCFPDERQRQDPKLIEQRSIKIDGMQFGSRFGETLCAVDLDGNGFDDLVVGAPLFSQQDGLSDTGSVFVYRTQIKGGFLTEMELVTSSLQRDVQNSARFGAALANLGDLDGDGFEDFGVGAPFEGSGAIYIYRGSASFSFSERPQKITPSSLNQANQLRGFGFSFSQAVDTDDNGRPDFAVGALESGHAVILRAREVERISPDSSHERLLKAISPNAKDFSVKITAKLRRPARRNLMFRLGFNNLDDRIELPGEFRKGSNFMKGNLAAGSSAVPMTFSMKPVKPNFGVNMANLTDLPPPIRFFVEIQWELTGEGCPPLGCPLMDPLSRTTENIQFEVHLQSGCKDNDLCQCNMEVTNSQSDPVKILVGVDNTIQTKVTVSNSGTEPSYNAMLKIASARQLPLPREIECQHADPQKEARREFQHYIICRFPSLNFKTTKTYDITFDVSDWADLSDLDTLDIVMTLESKCATQTRAGNMESSTKVSFEYKPQVIISATDWDAGKQLSFNQTDVVFKHVYRIKNKGPSPTNEDFAFRIFVPKADVVKVAKVQVGDSNVSDCSVLTTGRFPTDIAERPSGGETVSCSSHICSVYECKLERGFLMDQEVSVVADLVFSPPSAANRKDDDIGRYSVRTLVRKASSVSPKEFAHVTTEFFSVEVSLKQLVIEYWPYGLGAIIGILLLVALVVVLWKSKAFSKMRIFQKQLEDAQKLDPGNAGEAKELVDT